MKGVLVFFSLVFVLSAEAQKGKPQKLPLDKIQLPQGFAIEVFAEVPNARSLAQTEDGRIIVGNRTGGSVSMVTQGKVQTLVDGLKVPNGVAVKGDKLFVAEVSRILEYVLPAKLDKPLQAMRELPVKFPSDPHHGWKFIRFAPDGTLVVPVGVNCNICDPGKDYARIFKVNIETGKKQEIAAGVRNTVGFDFHPETKELWFTDNGRDWLGDNSPPDELNRVTKEGQHFGFPFCHGKNIVDPEFGKGKKCSDYQAPEVELPAHVAALGMRFYTGQGFPEKYKNGIFIAEHGSWNRSTPQGYRIEFVQLQGSKVVGREVFADGWLKGDSAWGRPVDIEVLKDGSLLVSDDKAGVIYRIYYKGEK